MGVGRRRLNDAEVTRGETLVTGYPTDRMKLAGDGAATEIDSTRTRSQSIPQLVWKRFALWLILKWR
jgi:hypothetical protein